MPVKQRVSMPAQPPEVRIHNFDEVATGYTLEMALEEANRCIQCKNPTCEQGCPVHVPIKEFIGYVADNNLEAAIATISRMNALPAVCGRVCPQESQCEATCIYAKKKIPIAIGRLERFVADWDRDRGLPTAEAHPTGPKVAVVGGGPAGLTAAGDLARYGYRVTIFEALHTLGGVLMYGIPEFRLPKDIVQEEIRKMLALGVEAQTNAVVGRTTTIDDLYAEGYEAVFVGTGAGTPKFLGIPGESLNGVFSANEYLTRVNLMKAYRFPEYHTPVKRGNRVVVVGAGNVAMDGVRTALRVGAKEAWVVYRRSQEEMSARHEEYEHAVEEGVHFEFLTNPLEILGNEEGWVTGMRCQRMELGEPDESGRRRPVPVEGSEYVIECDQVIIALGTNPNPILVRSTKGLDTERWGGIKADENGLTSRSALWAGGDAVTGAATVILAMGAGKTAAEAIHQYLTEKHGTSPTGK